jgi:hypothetical protein
MENEIAFLRRHIERYRRLHRDISDERMSRELERMIQDAERRLKEIEAGS